MAVGLNPASHEYVTPGQFQAAANYAAAQKAKEEQAKSLEDRKKVEQSKKTRFRDLLKKADSTTETENGLPPKISGMEYEEAITYLLDNVTMAAENFKNNPYTNAFSEYRTKVSHFLRFVELKAYDIETSVSRPTRRRPNAKKRYLIKVIDDNLEQLARDILYNQADQLKMLAKVDEINGLIIDLFS